jgi:N-acetylglutamate synthase-like GNAT family acetyltransferase
MIVSKLESIRLARTQDIDWIKSLADRHRDELGFITRSIIEDAVEKQEILVSCSGFLHFHNRKDLISTLYHICIDRRYQNQGIGRQLIQFWEQHSQACGMKRLRLKCPIDLAANGFYSHLGFIRTKIERGKKRSLVVWEKNIKSEKPKNSRFFASLSAGGMDLKLLKELWQQGKDPRNPFKNVLYSPISCPQSTTKYLYRERMNGDIQNIWLDCGAYQVQQGKITYDRLLSFLYNFYVTNQWADGYILPDVVPLSTDNDDIVEYKVRETIYYCTRFYQQMPEYIQERAIAPVQGRTVEHIHQCIEAYSEMGITRIGFGSWGTSGPNDSVNMLSQSSLNLFAHLEELAREHGMKIHCFGIGGPNSYNRMKQQGIIPHTLDSTTWWKAGGFGSIFFPNTSQIQITLRRNFMTTKAGLEALKKKSNHNCYFCQNFDILRNNRNYRIMHNLAAWLDTLEV